MILLAHYTFDLETSEGSQYDVPDPKLKSKFPKISETKGMRPYTFLSVLRNVNLRPHTTLLCIDRYPSFVSGLRVWESLSHGGQEVTTVLQRQQKVRSDI